MTPDIMLLAAVGLAVVNAIVFYLIIRNAVSAGTETPKQLKHAWAQTELLLAMARKSGVDEGALKAITDHLR